MKDLIKILQRVDNFKIEAEQIFRAAESPGKAIPNLKGSSYPSKRFEIGVLTATHEEFQGIISLLEDVREFELESDSFIYYSGVLIGESKKIKIVIPYPIGMGIPSVVSSATKIISNFHPRFIFMVGIAAGNKNVNNIGDILIANKTLNYNEVVEIEKKDKSTLKKFMQKADGINKYLEIRFKQFSRSKHVIEIQNDYHCKEDFATELRCMLGLVVTGNSLVRSQSKIEEINSSYHGVIGLDMETSGFYFSAVNILKDNAPLFASIKSVSDFGDNSKHKQSSKQRKDYAIYTSSQAFKTFVLNYI